MSLLWILSCRWSKGWGPSPVGACLMVHCRIFVGGGCGPMLLTPVFSAMSLISQTSLSSCSRLVLVSLTLAYCGIVSSGAALDWILTCLLFHVHAIRLNRVPAAWAMKMVQKKRRGGYEQVFRRLTKAQNTIPTPQMNYTDYRIPRRHGQVFARHRPP